MSGRVYARILRDSTLLQRKIVTGPAPSRLLKSFHKVSGWTWSEIRPVMRFIALILMLIGIAGAAVWGTLQSFGHFSVIPSQFDGICTPVTGVAGPEDIDLDSRRGVAFLSSLDRTAPDTRGAIHRFAVNDPLAAAGWRDMTDGVPEVFRPLGLDYFDGAGVQRLFVINEATNGVELFDVAADGALTHIKSFTERRLTSPNNVVAVGPESFYVTNDVKAGRQSLRGQFNFLTRAATGEVFYIEDGTWRVAASGLRFANGIEISGDGRSLYVAETAADTVKVFDRDPASGSLTHRANIAIPGAPDNITVDADGEYWVAAHPKPLAVAMLATRPEAHSPSMVVRIPDDMRARTVYVDDGSNFSSSSAAAFLGETLMITGLYERKFLLCELPGEEI